MKHLITLGLALVLSVATAAGQTYNSREYLRVLQQAAGGPAGLNLGAPKAKLIEQLAEIEALLPLAPDQAGRDIANGHISILFALLDNKEEAMVAAGRIVDVVAREKRRLHILQICDGTDAALDLLKTLLADPSVPEAMHVHYVEKLANSVRGAERNHRALAAISVEYLGKTRFRDSTAQLGERLLKFCADAHRAGAVDAKRFAEAVSWVADTTPPTARTEALIAAAEQIRAQLAPAARAGGAGGR
jgi:hypothetical protein